MSPPFQNASGPSSAAPFFEIEFLQVAGPGGLASGKWIRPFRPLLKPGPQLWAFEQVRIETGDPLPDHDQAAEHLDGKVPGAAPGDLREPSLRPDPGAASLIPGAADFLVRVPDPVEAAWVLGAKRRHAGFVERAGRAATCYCGLLSHGIAFATGRRWSAYNRVPEDRSGGPSEHR